MKTALLFLIIISLVGCSQTPTYTPSPKERLANQIMKKVALTISKEKGLRPAGSGGRAMHEIKMLALSFNYYQDITIEEGRELLVYAVNEFANAINATEEIRPYLANYPFEPKNIEITIALFNPDGTTPSLGKLVLICADDGELSYKIDNPDTKLFTTVLEESFEEARNKISYRNVAQGEKDYWEKLSKT